MLSFLPEKFPPEGGECCSRLCCCKGTCGWSPLVLVPHGRCDHKPDQFRKKCFYHEQNCANVGNKKFVTMKHNFENNIIQIMSILVVPIAGSSACQ